MDPGDGRARMSEHVSVVEEIHDAILGVESSKFAALVRSFPAVGQGRIFFAGYGRSGLVARMIAMRFMHLGHRAHVVGDATTPSIGAGDTLLLVSRSGRRAAVLLAQAAKAEGARVVAVTQGGGGDLEELADHVLGLPGTERSVQFGGALFE